MLEYHSVSHAFYQRGREHPAVAGVDLTVKCGEFLCILGPSGCGKSTLLNMAAGFILPEIGQVHFLGKQVTGPGRDRAVVFQEPALIPWLTVEQNIRLALKSSRSDTEEQVDKALKIAGLRGVHHSMPHELSGGMKQKAAIARAVAMGADLMLMDEPFSSLDEQTRLRMNREIVDLWRGYRKTVVFITHSIQEAVLIGTRIVLMSSRPARISQEWVLGDDGCSGYDRQNVRLADPNFLRMTAEIRRTMELCCPPGEGCNC